MSFPLEARESFEFKIGDKIHVLSDKAYRKTTDDLFEAVGNVVITHGKNAIYGEKATMNMKSGETKIIGNVRYIGPMFTIYGSMIHYNFKTKFLSVKNARIMSQDYVILGKDISRHTDTVLTGENAEYTTCKDCPESWSIYGKKVHITIGEYVRIQHAYIKVKGVVVMYVPYIIFPIKKNRETGFLFPKFGLNISKGATFQQPWFWAIDPSKDMTLTPSVWGRRGLGNEFQYRHMFGEKKWFEINSLQSRDRIYQPDRNKDEVVSGKHYFRHFTDYEHHFVFGHHFNHHLYYNDASDLDTPRDFNAFTDPRVRGNELGGGGFLEFRNSLIDINLEGFYNKNLLVPRSRQFDHSYVQILPEISFSSVPYTILHTSIPGLQNISFGLQGDYTTFKQDQHNELEYIRNAHRVNAEPYLDWELGDLGPFHFKTGVRLDYQHYRFPYERQETFSKRGLMYESEISFALEKIFGLAYKEDIPVDRIDLKKYDQDNVKKSETSSVVGRDLIGTLPHYREQFAKNHLSVQKNSYRHTQEYKIKHYYMSDQQIQGNERFRYQIANSQGVFDHVDAIRSKEHELASIMSRTTIPMSNTVEIQWNNSVIKKSPKIFNPLNDGKYLRDNFTYSQVSYFNISQGYDFSNKKDDFEDGLTRLFVGTGFTLSETTFALSEYYFYKTKKNILSVSFSQKFDNAEVGTGLNYNSTSSPANKKLRFTGSVTPIDLIKFGTEINYNIETKKYDENNFNLLYSPRNNCWKLELSYQTTRVEKKYSLNFMINYNKNNFTSIAGNRE